jgi:hypothetical protein
MSDTFTGPRGLVGFARVRGTGGETIEVQESSAVAVVGPREIIEGPFVWLRVIDSDRTRAVAHLTREQAREIRDSLTEFLRMTETDDV